MVPVDPLTTESNRQGPKNFLKSTSEKTAGKPVDDYANDINRKLTEREV